MSYHSERTIELDPITALALRDWLVTLNQHLGLDAAAAADAPILPTSVAPDEIAPDLGELAFLLDASGCPDPETATVRISIASEPAVDIDRDRVFESQLNVLDDPTGVSDADPAFGDPGVYSPSPDTGGPRDVDSDPTDVSVPARGYYVDPERDDREYDLGIHAPSMKPSGARLQRGLLDRGRGPRPPIQRVEIRTRRRLHPGMSPLTLIARADWSAERTALSPPTSESLEDS